MAVFCQFLHTFEMAESHVVSALLAKRAKLAGDIAKLDQETRAIRSKIAQVDGCLRLFGYEGDPREVTPHRTNAAHLLPRGKLQRSVLEIMREAKAPLSNRLIAAELICRMGWAVDDGELLDRVAVKVKDVTKRSNLRR
jgi:hypothetical protein